MISDKCNYYINLPKRNRKKYIATLSEEEQLIILNDIYILMNIELSKIIDYINNIVKK